jgi:hypothetical protein
MGANHRRDENREHPMNDQHADQTDPEGKGPRYSGRLSDQDRRGSRTDVSGGSGALADPASWPGPHARRRARPGVAGAPGPGAVPEVVDEDAELEPEPVLEVPVGRDEFGRPVEVVVAEGPVAATHWDGRLWERRS